MIEKNRSLVVGGPALHADCLAVEVAVSVSMYALLDVVA